MPRSSSSAGFIHSLPKELTDWTNDTIQSLDLFLSKTCEIQQIVQPLWSILLKSTHCLNPTYLIARVVLKIASFLQTHEKKLTLKPIDLDKVMVNILTRILDNGEPSASVSTLSEDIVNFLHKRLDAVENEESIGVKLSFLICLVRLKMGDGIHTLTQFLSLLKNYKDLQKAAKLARLFFVHFNGALLTSEILYPILSSLSFHMVEISLPNLIIYLTEEETVLLMKQLQISFPSHSDDIVLLLLTAKPLKNIFLGLSLSSRPLGDLFVRTMLLCMEESAPDYPETDTKMCQKHRYVELVLKKCREALSGLCEPYQIALLQNISRLLGLLEADQEADLITYGEFFARYATKLSSWDTCHSILQILATKQQAAKVVTKLSYYAGCQLYQKSRWSDAVSLLKLPIDNGAEDENLLSRLELLSMACFKYGNFIDCNHYINRCFTNGSHIKESVLEKWACYARHPGYPCKFSVEWSHRLLERMISKRYFQEADKVICGLSQNVPMETLYWKHRRFLWKWKDEAIERLLDEARKIIRETSVSQYWKEVFSLYEMIWRYSLGEGINVADKAVVKSDELTVPLINGLKLLCNLNDAVKESETLKQARESRQQGRILEAITSVHVELVNFQWKSRQAHLCVFDAAQISQCILQHMSALTCLYQTLGVYKPYSLYLEQAKKLAASLHTNYHWSDPHEKVLISTDLSAKEGPGFFYIQHVSSVSCIQEAWAILNGSSPAKFKSFVYCSIQSRSLSTVDAVGMLNISSWLEFERRHQYDQLDLRNPTIIRDEPIVSEENFEAFIKTHSRQRSNFSTICLFYDNTFDKLIISVHKTEPVLMVIPFHGKSFTAQSCVEMIQSIMDKNKEILFGHTKSSVAVDIQSAEFKRNWWKARKELDAQLAEIAERINNEWLAPFSKYLIDDSSIFPEQFEAFEKLLREIVPVDSQCAVLVPYLLSLGPTPKAKHLDSALDVIEATLDVTFDDRPAALRNLRNSYAKVFDQDNLFLVQHERPHNELFLVIDKRLHSFPWEMTDTFSGTQIYRQASIWHLDKLLNLWGDGCENIDPNSANVGFILNPGGDLVRTEAYFLDRLKKRWDGIVRRPPNEEEFKSLLETKDLFLYFGHGGGDAYIRSSQLRSLPKPSPPSFLIGCSSGKLIINGEFCPEGTLLNYLQAGCRTVLVNLWDVTDRDIDKFTDVMFEKMCLWRPEDGETLDTITEAAPAELAEAVNVARKVCFLPFLNGAAPVVYGLPLRFSAMRN